MKKSEIKNGTHFSKCTKEQLEWAKQYDKFGTELLIETWEDPEENCCCLSDDVWMNYHWVSWED